MRVVRIFTGDQIIMQFRNTTKDQLLLAMDACNAQYDDNIRFKDWIEVAEKRGTMYQFTLRTVRGGVIGSRLSTSGRKINAASWEVHRDFLWALFDINPYASVKSWIATYNGRSEFIERFPVTGDQNVGSMLRPVTIRQLTYIPGAQS